MKARSMLLMTFPNEHLMTFNQYKDAKTLFTAIQTRFGGNEAIKKTQKTLLKQMYENFSAPSTESLDSIFNRLQKIVSQLAGHIHGENISQEDLNLKFLRSLPSEWNTHVVVWRNKPDLDIMSFDYLYNNFKIVEQQVKGTASSSSSSQNMAFVSSPSSTNEVNTAYGVSTANTQVSTASTQVSTANLSDDTVYAFLANQLNGSQLVHEDLKQIHEDYLEEMDLKWQLALLTGYDKSKVECFNCHKLGHFARERRGPRNQDNKSKNQDNSRRTINVEEVSSKAMLAIDGADSEVHNDKTCSKTYLKSFETLKTQLDDLRIEFNKSEFNLANYKRGLASVEKQLVFYKKNEVLFCEQLAVLKRDISYKDSEISVLKSELEKLKQEKESNQLKIEKFDNASKSLDKLIGSQIPDKSRKGLGFVSYNVVPPPLTGLFSPLNLNLSNSGLEEFQQPEFEGYGPKTSKSVSEDTSNEVRESPDASLVEELVSNDKLEKKTVFPTVAKINFVRPQQQEKPVRKPVKYAEMYSFDHVQANCNYHQRERMVSGNNYTRVNYNYSAKKAHPSAHRNIVPRAVLMKTGLRPLNTARPVNTAHPKTTVYSARPMSSVMSDLKDSTGTYTTVHMFTESRFLKLGDDVDEDPEEDILLIFLSIGGRRWRLLSRADRPKVTLPPRKRLGIALGPSYEVGESSFAAATRPTGGLRADYGFVATIDREIMRDLERDLMAGRLNMLYRDRRTHARTTRLMEAEARMSREDWDDLWMRETGGDYKDAGGRPQETKAAHRGIKAAEETSDLDDRAMINQGVTVALAARDADRNTNGDDSHILGAGVRRTERTARECTYTDFLKCQLLNFKGTEGVSNLSQCEHSEPTTTIRTRGRTLAGLILQGLVKRNNMGDLNPYAQNATITTMVHVLLNATKLAILPMTVGGHFRRESPKMKNNINVMEPKLEVALPPDKSVAG
ncbi:ribonuclease H-like domain-containing protein [Tanacetum coccineum]|uniref:Ribonuclease H-like domain-containing protein n=1 Tax=Tanacetum coccineum TaxID=301880 RepID=A0ABQ5BG89_9ASTR